MNTISQFFANFEAFMDNTTNIKTFLEIGLAQHLFLSMEALNRRRGIPDFEIAFMDLMKAIDSFALDPSGLCLCAIS